MAEKESVRRSYDALAEIYADQRSGDGQGMAVLEAFLESLDDTPRLLDAGCGAGTPVLSHLDRVAAAVGVDFSREQLRLAARNAPGAAVCQGDMTALPYREGAFDGVLAYWSLIHVPLGEHQAVLDEFARVLRPGGHLLVCEGTNEWVGESPDWLDSGVGMQWEIAGADTTREQLRNAGFTVVETWGVPETLADDEADADGDRRERNGERRDDEDEDADVDVDVDEAVDADVDEDVDVDGHEDENEQEANEEDWTFFAARLDT